MDRIQTPFDSVQKTPSYRSVTYKTKVGSLGKGKLLKMKKLAEKEKNSEELNNLYLESSHKKNRLEEKNTFERKHILPSSKVLNIRTKRQQYKANAPSEIFVYEECVKSMTEMIYIMLEEESVDRTLENFNFNTAYQATTLFKQVVYALAVAEENCEFEHRNLVRENIGIKLTNCKTFCYSLHSHQYEVRTAGLEVVIMDFNCSRMTYGHWSSQAIVYRNLDNFVNQVSKETDGRNDVYCNMKNYD
ncbi:Serine/threonine-protein kinase haspin homolog [Gryllus bimaculatus]|nr:Serine/threonine-protein kinase haspin homolog [Gryllus bimaculatus]